MRFIGYSFILLLVPFFVSAQAMKVLPKSLDSQDAQNFFHDVELVMSGQPSISGAFADFKAKSAAASDPKAYWESVFKDYNAEGEKYVAGRGVKISFTDDVSALQKAIVLRKLHQKLKVMKQIPDSDTEIHIFSSTSSAQEVDKLLGAGTAAKAGLNQERTIGSFDRLYKFDKHVVLWDIQKLNGKTQSVNLTFEDKSTYEFKIPEELKKGGLALEIRRGEDAIFLPGAPLKSTEVGGKRAVIAKSDGSYDFRDAVGEVTADTSLAIVDSADAVLDVLAKSDKKAAAKKDKKHSMIDLSNPLDFVVPDLHPRVCASA
jgi:hypothetical protein